MEENALDDLNPLGYLPVIKDFLSLMQGYDVERTDMSIVKDVWEEVTDIADKLVNGEFGGVDDWHTVATLIGDVTGVPVGNVIRDIDGIVRTYLPETNERNTAKKGDSSWAEIKYGMLEELSGSAEWLTSVAGLKIWDSSKAAYYTRMVDAINKDDAETFKEISGYLTGSMGVSDKAMMTGIKTDIKDRYASGLIDEEKAEELLVKAGIVEEEKVKETVYDWKAKKDTGDEDATIYTKLKTAVANGGEGLQEAREELIKAGKTEKEVNEKVKTEIGTLYKEGKINDKEAGELLVKTGVVKKDDVKETILKWDNKMETGSDAIYAKVKMAVDKGGEGLQEARDEMIIRCYVPGG